MLLYIIRHGQTDHNVAGIIQGQLDTPLNDHGRHQASLVSKRLATTKFTEIWSSSLSRAKETADIIARPHYLPVQTHEGLMERGLGSLESRRRLPGEALPGDIESSDAFRKRITTWFTSFLSAHRESSGPICIVSHGAYITTFASLLLSPVFGFKRHESVHLSRGCHNTSIMTVECTLQGDRWSGEVLGYCDIDHLEQREDGPASRVADDLKA